MDTIDPQKKLVLKECLQEYINTFTEKEKKAYEIASSHLGSSFNLEKSLGFIQWMKSRFQTSHQSSS